MGTSDVRPSQVEVVSNLENVTERESLGAEPFTCGILSALSKIVGYPGSVRENCHLVWENPTRTWCQKCWVVAV